MGIRDQEIDRLVKYAQGMGVKVSFRRKSVDSKNSAYWTLDGTEIVVYIKNDTTKTETILALIHEIGHHVWFVNERNRQPDLKFEEAIDRQNLHDENLTDTPAPKKLREKILSVELAGTKWWDVIYNETNLKIPKWKMYAEMEFDTWMYKMFAENGSFPKGQMKRDKYKEITAKYKGRKYD